MHDTNLGLTERGLLITLLSLPDGWNLSIAGLTHILPDGKDKIAKGNFGKYIKNYGQKSKSVITIQAEVLLW